MKEVSVNFSFWIQDSFFGDRIDTNLAEGVNNLFVIHNHPHVSHGAILF